MIATQLARFSCFLAVLLSIGCQSIASVPASKWELRRFNTASVLEMRSEDVNEYLISRLKDDYKKDPADSRYPDLKFSSAFESADSKNKFYVFDILFVEDAQVVYELNAHDLIVDKYIKSQWR